MPLAALLRGPIEVRMAVTIILRRVFLHPPLQMPTPMILASPVFPALYLYPLNDSFFIPKQIVLASPGRRVFLGRKTGTSPPPDETQVYFDSSVVSRRHAEVWQEGNKARVHRHKLGRGSNGGLRRYSSATQGARTALL